jgi:hypothetical protein
MSCSTINWPPSLSQRNRPCRSIAQSRSKECPHAAGRFLAYLRHRGDPVCRAILTATSNDEPGTRWHGRRPNRRGGCPSSVEYGYYQWPLWEWSLHMHMRRFMILILALLMAACSGGHAVAQEQTPVPVPPPLERPQVLPIPPEVQTFAVCGVGTKCECDTVVSFAQAREGQSCTVTSSTGSCTFQSRNNEVGVCCVCRP